MPSPNPIWKRDDISKIEFRLLWFLIDVGGMGHTIGRGWQKKCAECLGRNRITINRIVKRLVAKGLLVHSAKKGEVEFNPAGFESPLPDNFVKLRELHDEP